MLLPALAGVALVLIATRNGAGISIDSVVYISVAREVAAGHGLVLPWGAMEPQPVGTRWAPLLPGLLAAIRWLGPDPIDSIRWLNAVFFGGTILLVGLVFHKATASAWLACAGAGVVASSRALIDVHSMAWTEPAYLFLQTAGLILIALFATTGRKLALLAAFLTTILALLARHAGAALAMTAFASLVFGRGRMRNRLLAGTCLCAMIWLPMYPGGPTWVEWGRSHFMSDAPVPDPDGFLYEQLATNLDRSTAIFAAWLWPWLLRGISLGSLARAAVVLLAAAALIFAITQARRSEAFHRRSDPAALRANLCWVFGVFLLVYPAFLLTAVLLFGRAQLNFDERMLLPMMIPGLIVGIIGGHVLWERSTHRRAPTALALAGCCLALAIRLPRAFERAEQFASTSGVGAEGYHDAKWRTSPTISAVKALPANVPIYTNAPDAVYILTGRKSAWLPSDWNLAHPGVERDDGYSKLPELREALSDGAVIAFFERLAWRGSSPERAALEAILPLRTLEQTDDGVLYASAAEVTPAAP